ncbi:MAG: aminomethyl-transferring glycine dehydrogenase subunit GcvPB, partial [bacterium]
MIEPLIFELHRPSVRCGYVPESDLPTNISPLDPQWLRGDLKLPQVSEPEVVRHFIRLSTLNHHVDKDFYPLGSCTMKYNPKVNETISQWLGFSGIHPHQPEETVQGAMRLMADLEKKLSIITGLDAVTLQPAAGSHGELTGLFITRAYHLHRNEKRTEVLIPDSAHGT